MQYEILKVRPAKITTSPKGTKYIKAGQRVTLGSLDHYSDLNTGLTYIFNERRTKVKRIQNVI